MHPLVGASVRRSGVINCKVLGAGPTGSLLALALGRLGCGVTLSDPLSPSELCSRSRAYALTHSSRGLLQSLELWDELQGELSPFNRLCVEDRELQRRVWFDLKDLSRTNQAQGAVGWILDHQPLMSLLLDRLNTLANISLQLGTGVSADDQDHDLVLAADGSGSPTRQSWNLPTWRLDYRQGCLTAKVLLRGADPLVAHESFRAEGPLAVLPLGGEAFQVVWSAPLTRCQQRAQLDSAAFLDQLATVLPLGLEADVLLDTPRAFPQALQLSRRLYQGRRILVGEAGHRCHPIGGQGLNLCWRDVNTLIGLVEKVQANRLPLSKLARRYARQRWIDLLLVSLFTDLLLRLFSSRNRLKLLLRLPMLVLLKRLSWLRSLCLSLMTDGVHQDRSVAARVKPS